MQTVSSDFTTATSATMKKINQGCLIAWNLAPNSSFSFFTIGVSAIGGADVIKGGGGSVTFFDKYQYTDESKYVIDWKITRKLSQKPYGVVMAQAEITLDNNSLRFTPGYDATIGAYILPNRVVRLCAGFNGETINQFVGYTDRPITTVSTHETTITAYDALYYLNNKKSALQSLVNYRISDILIALLNEQGFSSSQYNIEPSLSQAVSYYNPNGQKVIDMFTELVEAEMGLMFVDENGIITFWNRQHMNNNRTSQWTFNYSNLTGLDWDNTPIINSVKVVARPYKVMSKTLVWTNGQPITLAPNASTDVFADFSDNVGSFPCTSIDAPQPLASATTSEYTVNYNSDGSGSDASGGVSLSSSYLFGASYRMTFTNTTNQNIYITKLELYGVPAKVQLIDAQHVDDTTSQSNYGINPDNNGDVVEIDNNVIQDSSTAYSLGFIIVSQYSTPLFRLIAPAFAVPQLQLGDGVTVNIQDTSQTKTPFVVGITTVMDANGMNQEFDVEERPTYTYFTIGVSKIGGTDNLSP